jgi:hypothetical protein
MTRLERVFVWAGGTVFVLSLAFAAYTYVVSFGTVRPWTGWTAVAVNAVVFSVFALHHSLFARDTVKQWLTAIPARLLRSVYVWIASALLAIVFVAWQPVGGALYDLHGAAAWLLIAVQLAGIWLIARAVGKIDPLELAGIHIASPTAEGAGVAREPLQITGPYRLVRHPLYFGWVLATFGAPRMTGDRLAFAVIAVVYLIIAVPWEEQSLLQSFGDDYARYQQQVRWRIVPYVY